MDFRYAKLQGRSFKNQNLNGADFRCADIRGANFSNAILVNANFSHAKAGLQLYWLVIIATFALFLSALSGVIYIYACLAIAELRLHVNFFWFIVNIFALIIFCTATIFKGLEAATGIITIIYVCILILTIAISPQNEDVSAAIIAGLTVGSVSVAGAITSIMILAVGVVIIKILFGNIVVILPVLMALCGSITGNIFADVIHKNELILTITIALSLILFGVYIGVQALCENQKYSRIKIIAITLCSQGGTNFRGANLTDANFTQAQLKSTDFREATITRTVWYKAGYLHFARRGKSYLHNTELIQVLVNRQGQDRNFERLSLRGVNLQGTNLKNASFIGTDLSESNLQDADFSGAKLKQTQLDETDFTGATLTGTFIEDWGITNNTKFNGVKCEYVYMRLPTKDNPDPRRKPDNYKEFFADGEFGDFIQPIFDTLDLYHNQGVDPRAIAIAFKELAQNNPNAELEIVAIERRGSDKILLRAKTATSANKSELSREYFINYNQLKALAENDFKVLIAEKDIRIADLQKMVVTALQRPSFYAQTYQNQGDTIMAEASKQVFNNNLPNAQFAGGLVNADTVTVGHMGGNITNYTPQQRQNLVDAAAEIQQLLNQLSQTYPTATTSEKMTIVAKAVDEIENNPPLKARVIGALKAGGTEAFKELIDNPLINILLASIEGWQEAE